MSKGIFGGSNSFLIFLLFILLFGFGGGRGFFLGE
jgi:hypothetical protein